MKLVRDPYLHMPLILEVWQESQNNSHTELIMHILFYSSSSRDLEKAQLGCTILDLSHGRTHQTLTGMYRWSSRKKKKHIVLEVMYNLSSLKENMLA